MSSLPTSASESKDFVLLNLCTLYQASILTFTRYSCAIEDMHKASKQKSCQIALFFSPLNINIGFS